MAAITRLLQLEHRTPRHHLATMAQKRVEHLAQVQNPRLAVNQRHHVHAEAVLHLRVFVEIVEDDFRHLATLEFDDRTHARLVRLVTDFGDAFQTLFAHQLADLNQQIGLVDLIRQLVDDNCLTVALLHVFDVGACAHDDAAATGT